MDTVTPDDITKALQPIMKRLRRLPPLERITVGALLNQALLDAQGVIALERRSGVRELRGSGWTLADIGSETSMTPQRVMQLEQGADRKSKKG